MNFNKYKNLSKQYDVEFSKLKIRKSLKKLLLKKNKSLGRSYGTIVAWHRGGGVKRLFRPIFNYNNLVAEYCVLRSIEYDPNRSTFIGLVQFQDGSFSNILVSSNNKIGDVINY